MESKRLLAVLITAAVFLNLAPLYGQDTAISVDVAPKSALAVDESITYVQPGNVTVNFKDAEIRAVLNYISEVSGVDIVPSPDVAGTITLKLTDKPWEVALDIIVKNYGYAYERDGDIIRVVTLSSLKLEELSTEVVSLNYITAEDGQEAVKDMLTERGKLTFDSRVNALVITDLATNIYKIKRVIGLLDRKTPQIMIDAKVIETALDDTERLGINWSLVIGVSGAKRPITLPFDQFTGNIQQLLGAEFKNFYFPASQPGAMATVIGVGGVATETDVTEFPAAMPVNSAFPFAEADDFTFGTLDFSQFGAVMEYLNTRSNTHIISNPRITTLNNKAAKMFVGMVYNYISEMENDKESDTVTYNIEKEE
ncbi:MAG: secretin N-terminal domain-containing protein, partial [Candidatus Omnitrophota bacterium]